MQDRLQEATGPAGLGPVEHSGGALVTVGHLLLIAVAILVYLFAIDLRTDLATGWVDSAIYHALFLDTWAIQDRFGDVYWLSRWPWVVTGKAFFAMFPPAMASFMMTWVVSWGFGAAFYALARQFVQPGAAVAVAIIAGCNL
jgi:hypothetical protein